MESSRSRLLLIPLPCTLYLPIISHSYCLCFQPMYLLLTAPSPPSDILLSLPLLPLSHSLSFTLLLLELYCMIGG
jgi:hypothetical protein